MGRSEEIEKAARKTIKLIRELAGYEVGSMHPNDFAVRDEEVTHDVLRLHAEHGAALWKWRWKMGRSERDTQMRMVREAFQMIIRAKPNREPEEWDGGYGNADDDRRQGMDEVYWVHAQIAQAGLDTLDALSLPPAEVDAARERFTDAAYRYWMWQRRGRSAGMGTVQERHRTVSAAFDALLAAEKEARHGE